MNDAVKEKAQRAYHDTKRYPKSKTPCEILTKESPGKDHIIVLIKSLDESFRYRECYWVRRDEKHKVHLAERELIFGLEQAKALSQRFSDRPLHK